MFSSIDEKKAVLDSKQPLPAYILNNLREKLMLEWIYNSNAIEGNTLTLIETKVVLEGITVGGKTIREHLEVINHHEAIAYVEEIISHHEPLSQWQMKNIHRLILKGILSLRVLCYMPYLLVFIRSLTEMDVLLGYCLTSS